MGLLPKGEVTLNRLSTNQLGFTLHELITAVAIFLILTVVGVPSYISFVRNSQVSNLTTSLYTDLLYARSESLKRKGNVVLCRSANPSAASPSCDTAGTANDWSAGWLVFADINGNGTYDSGTDQILRVSNSSSTSTIKVISNSTANLRVTYVADGTLDITSVQSIFAICDDRDQNGSFNATDAAAGREITVSAVGRPKISTYSDGAFSCTNPS